LAKIKDLVKLIVYNLIDLMIKPTKAIKPMSLMLMRLDAIGDYVLFRNYIELIKTSKKYGSYNITLLGNIAWKDLAEELDNQYVDNFIWLDRNKFSKNLYYRYKKLKEISSLGYKIVINSAYSREFYYGDNIIKHLNAEEKIGSIGDLSNIRYWQQDKGNRYYTKLSKARTNIMFEFDRNKEFFENILETKLDIKKTYINLGNKLLDFKLPQKYALLFIGAGVSSRKWNIEKFANIAKHLKDIYSYEIVLCGGPKEFDDAEEFASYFNNYYIDLVGKTSLVELLYVIYSSNIMISNETSAPHFGVALETKNIFVISNGNHFKRFTPYPEEIYKNYYVIFHPEIENNINDKYNLCQKYAISSDLDINHITDTMVIKKLDKVLNV
jgi:ADP-heptose:LPS heptosyltransferase